VADVRVSHDTVQSSKRDNNRVRNNAFQWILISFQLAAAIKPLGKAEWEVGTGVDADLQAEALGSRRPLLEIRDVAGATLVADPGGETQVHSSLPPLR
jgi:hypothetical protein